MKADNNRPDLSVILITYNHKDYIEECLESVLSQKTDYRYEIIIIDDCSNDGTSDIIETFRSKHPDKIFHYRSTRNIGNGREAIFAMHPDVNGKYWAILEGDDFWIDEEKVETQLRFLEKHNDYIATTSAYWSYDEQKKTREKHGACLDEWDIEDVMTKNKTYSFYCHTSTYIWRNIFKHKSPDNFFWPDELKEAYTFGDVCLGLFMINQGGKVKRFKKAMTCYRITGKGVWTQLSAEEQTKGNEELIDRIDRITNYKYTEHLRTQQEQTNSPETQPNHIASSSASLKIVRIVHKLATKTKSIFKKIYSA